MRRRNFIAAVTAGSLAGCLSGEASPPSETSSSATKQTETATPVRRTADGLTASFRVVDGHEPIDDAATATFDGDTVTVTGTADPSGCNRPTLSAVRYDVANDVVHLAVGEKSRFGPTATVECGNASFDYRCVLAVDRGRPTTVEVVHDYRTNDDRSFTLERV